MPGSGFPGCPALAWGLCACLFLQSRQGFRWGVHFSAHRVLPLLPKHPLPRDLPFRAGECRAWENQPSGSREVCQGCKQDDCKCARLG